MKNLVASTDRLNLYLVTEADAQFIFTLVNDPSWIAFIGQRNVHSISDARIYIKKAFTDVYAKHGFGLYKVCLKDDTPIGISGLVKRDSLKNVDIGFAQLPQFCGLGYGLEAAKAVLNYAKEILKIDYIVAITSLKNLNSQALIKKLDFYFEKMIPYKDGLESMLFLPNEKFSRGTKSGSKS